MSALADYMKPLFIACAVIALAACISRSPQPVSPAPTVSYAPLVLIPTSTVEPEKSQPQATEVSSSVVPIRWNVEIIQNGQIIAEKDGEIHLQKAPFIIRVNLSKLEDVRLNVLNTNASFTAVQPGSYANDCNHGWHAFCAFGNGIAEYDFNKDEELYLGEMAHHDLYYNGPNDHRWSKVEFTSSGVVFERNVSRLNIGDGLRITPIRDYDGQLYLLFLVKFRSEKQISADELKKMVLSFKEP